MVMIKTNSLKPAMDLIYLVSCAVNNEKPDKKTVSEMDLSAVQKAALEHSFSVAAACALEQVITLPENLKEEKYKAIRRLTLLNVERKKVIDALEKKGVEAEIFGALKGNTALMLSNTGNAPAKLIKEFTKGDKTGEAKPQLKAAYVEETVYVGKQNLEFLCSIKSKNELIAELVALLQSPAKNVVSALQSGQNTIHGVLQTLGERAE